MDNKRYELGILVAGFIGSIVLISNKGTKSFRQAMVSIGTGVAVAYFLTPLFVTIPFLAELGIVTSHKTDFAVSFILGATGWKVVELLINKLTNKLQDKNGNNN